MKNEVIYESYNKCLNYCEMIKNPILKEVSKKVYSDYKLKVGNNSALLGHSYEGTHIIENYLKEYDIDEQFKNQVLHMIGSHMREYSEWGVLVLPKMLEVIILNFADSIDAHLEPVHKILKETEIGNVYKINNDSRDYYKSLNPYYNKERYD